MIRIIISQVYLWLDKPEKAKKNLINLVKKYEKSYIGHKMLANIYEQEGKLEKAIDEYVITLDIRKNDYNSYYKISLLLHKLNKKEETIDMLTTLLKNKPQMLEASMLLRRNLSRRKRIQKGN